MKTAKQLNQSVKVFLKSYKNQATKLQSILDDFFESFNAPQGLNKNSTPLSNLLKDIRETDVALVRKYISIVSNAKVMLKANGSYVLRLEGEDLVLNEKYGTIKWNELAKNATVTIRDDFKSMPEALKATTKTMNKVFKTIKTRRDFLDFKETIDDLMNSYIAPAE